MSNVTLAHALIGGFISFAAPCVLPLVPPYLCYLAGVSLDELEAGKGAAAPARVARAAIAFVAGFATVFVTLGATASAFGRLVMAWSGVLSMIAGAAIIVMGLHFLGILRIPLLYREARIEVTRKPAGLLGAYVMGLAFAFGWTPCLGPILAAILVVAGSEATVGRGALLLAVYAIGLGIPFVLAALFAGPFLALMNRVRTKVRYMEAVIGVLLIVTGIAMLSGWLTGLSFWLLETFPGLALIG